MGWYVTFRKKTETLTVTAHDKDEAVLTACDLHLRGRQVLSMGPFGRDSRSHREIEGAELQQMLRAATIGEASPEVSPASSEGRMEIILGTSVRIIAGKDVDAAALARVVKVLSLDTNLVGFTEAYEMEYWMKKFGVSKERLADAVAAVGHSAEKVGEYLKRPPRGDPGQHANSAELGQN
jgi:hypothetical protein